MPTATIANPDGDVAGASAPATPALPGSASPDGGDADGAIMLDAARRGDRAAWGWMYRRYARLVHAVLLSRVPAHDAEDLVQDVFARAMGGISGLRDPSCVGAWLASAARNRATDFLRQRRRRRVEPLDGAPEPVARSEATAEATEILGAIRRLPEAYRETLTMRLVEGLTGPEIAERMGMTHGSVRVNLHRGLALLRENLGTEAKL